MVKNALKTSITLESVQYEAFDRLAADIDLWQYPNYYRYKEIYIQNGFNSYTYLNYFGSWFNNPYIEALNNNPAFSPPMLIITFAGALAMAAAMALVFNLKLKKNINEYAILRSLDVFL